MTADERLEDLMAHLPYVTKSGGAVQFRERLRFALLETSKDQRHACAEAVLRCKRGRLLSDSDDLIRLNEAHQAVMNA